MDLDRLLARTKLAGYLFVQETSDYEREDLPLSRCQRVPTAHQITNLTALAPRLGVTFDGTADRREQMVVVERFFEEVDRTRFHGTDTGGHVAVAGDEDDREIVSCLRQLVLQIEPSQSGESNIEHEA